MKKRFLKLIPAVLAAAMMLSVASPAYADTTHGEPHKWVADKTEKDDSNQSDSRKDNKKDKENAIKIDDTKAVAETGFQDVSSSSWYYDAVKWVKDKGITSGTSATTFSPDRPCTRVQMVTFLWRMSGSAEGTGTTKFKDVSPNSYAADAIAWAYGSGITSGTSETTFSPDQPCNREQMAVFLWRYYVGTVASLKGYLDESNNLQHLKSSYKTGFSDIPANRWSADAVYGLKLLDVTSGTSATTYSPSEPCTRAQMATFLYRMDQMAIKETGASIIGD